MGFAGKRIVVMGLGRFGGGISVTRWLHAQGAKVHVTDIAQEDVLVESLAALKDLDISYRLGGHDEADLNECDLLVVSPAVDKRKAAFFQAATARGIPWTSEMNLFIEHCRAKIIGITGTVGKSTTTAMIGAILDAARATEQWSRGQVWLGGNIGKSLLDDLAAIAPPDVVVLELSSFQLEDIAQLRRSPHIALITNFRDNHLDRHGTLEAYAEAKANIYRYHTPDDWLVLPFEGGVDLLPPSRTDPSRLYRFGVDPDSRHVKLAYQHDGQRVADELSVSLSIPGLHNVENAAAALAVSRILGVSDTVAVEALSRFSGLAHRLEFVRELEGVKYYNDSKATTPTAAMTSLKAFDGGIVVLVGGSDKGSSFTEWGRELAARAKAVICMGDTRDKIRSEILPAEGATRMPIVETASHSQEGIDRARELAEPGDVVLLSPGCASFDWFRNYEERGETFKVLVKALT
ncbi:MAG: UDP-N-acetylmuramoyl-L-alanine--D-glutamate ligase [Phycisphaerae bacterium]|nr:UDP-N-acetylmuramoyl-L-alanine--D-glutamate ligase [Phycisphaerae bacterium]